MDKELANIRKDLVRFIEKAIAFYGEPRYVEYYNFYLKHLGLSGLGGRLVSVKEGRVILGDNENGVGDITDELEYLSVIATALADPKNIFHDDKWPRL